MSGFGRRNPRQFIPHHFGHKPPALLSLIALLLLLGMGAAGCSTSETQHVTGKVERAYTRAEFVANSQVHFPSYVTAEMQDGYEYALARPDQLQYIPCYCGCGFNAGHESNLECYIAGVDQSGTAVFDNHASFCAICLEITRDVKRLSAEGKPLREIRAYVDQTHSEKGPGTDTPQPPS